MWEKYKETFDGVHASQRLKTEVLIMKREEKATRKRRIPVAALAAAILAVILAGTAVAVEIINRAAVELIEPNEMGISTDGYYLTVNFSPTPLESFSEEALAGFAGSEEDFVNWYFDTREESADFLGVDLLPNSMLGNFRQDGSSSLGGLALMAESGKVPAAVNIVTIYQDKRTYNICEMIDMEVDIPEAEEYAGRPLGHWETIRSLGEEAVEEKYSVEEYEMANGLTAAIVMRSGRGKNPEGHGTYSLESTRAYFVKDNACYTVDCELFGKDSAEELSMLKRILDAYE